MEQHPETKSELNREDQILMSLGRLEGLVTTLIASRNEYLSRFKTLEEDVDELKSRNAQQDIAHTILRTKLVVIGSLVVFGVPTFISLLPYFWK
jgi:hypothetical protein